MVLWACDRKREEEKKKSRQAEGSQRFGRVYSFFFFGSVSFINLVLLGKQDGGNKSPVREWWFFLSSTAAVACLNPSRGGKNENANPPFLPSQNPRCPRLPL